MFKYKDFADFLKQKNYPEFDKLEQDQVIQYQGEYLKEMREFQKEEQEKALKDQSDENEKALKALEDKVNTTMAKQIEVMLKSQIKQGEVIEDLLKKSTSIEVTLTPFEKSIEDNMDNIKKGVEEQHSESRSFVVDEKANFVAGSVTNNTDSMRLTDIGQLAHKKISIWDSLPKINVPANANGTVRYTDWDSASTVRAAATMAEGGTYAESTAVFVENSIALKKIGDSIPISEESLYDRRRFTNELNMFIRTNVDLVTDTQVYSGDNTGNNLKGFLTTATTFTPVASAITAPTIYDLFVKVKEAMMVGKNSKYNPNVAYMNIADINEYKLSKDANENYIMPPFVDANGNVIDGVTVIESNNVTTNTMVMADNRFIRIYQEPGVNVSTGLSGTQFVEDLVTLKARRRCQVLVREADRLGVYKVTDIAAALITLAL